MIFLAEPLVGVFLALIVSRESKKNIEINIVSLNNSLHDDFNYTFASTSRKVDGLGEYLRRAGAIKKSRKT